MRINGATSNHRGPGTTLGKKRRRRTGAGRDMPNGPTRPYSRIAIFITRPRIQAQSPVASARIYPIVRTLSCLPTGRGLK